MKNLETKIDSPKIDAPKIDSPQPQLESGEPNSKSNSKMCVCPYCEGTGFRPFRDHVPPLDLPRLSRARISPAVFSHRALRLLSRHRGFPDWCQKSLSRLWR